MKFTSKEENDIVRLREGGMSIKDIAKKMKLPYRTVSNKLLAMGIVLREERNWSKEEVLKLVSMKLEGFSERQIAEALDRSVGSINMKIFYVRKKLGGR